MKQPSNLNSVPTEIQSPNTWRSENRISRSRAAFSVLSVSSCSIATEKVRVNYQGKDQQDQHECKQFKPMADRGCGRRDATRPRRGLCLECLSNSSDQKLWMDGVSGHTGFRTRDSHARACLLRGRFVDEAERPSPRGGHRRAELRPGLGARRTGWRPFGVAVP